MVYRALRGSQKHLRTSLLCCRRVWRLHGPLEVLHGIGLPGDLAAGSMVLKVICDVFLRKDHHFGLRTLQIPTLPLMSRVGLDCHLPPSLKQFSGQKPKWPLSLKHTLLRVDNNDVFSPCLHCPAIIPDFPRHCKAPGWVGAKCGWGACSGILSCPLWCLSLTRVQRLTWCGIEDFS